MKKLLFCIGTLIAILFSSCSSSDLEVQYLPFKKDKDDNWGLINAKGEILYEDEFENCPSAIVNGYFSVEGKKGTYTVYKATEGSPTEIIDGLVSVGCMSEGLIPVTKKNCRISYINEKGEEQFTLDPIKGDEIDGVTSFFSDGLAIIRVKKKNKETDKYDYKFGAINSKGEVVIDPIYDALDAFKNGFAIAQKDSENSSNKNKYLVLNTKGEEVGSYKAENCEGRYNKYYVFTSNEKQSIIDISNECKEVCTLKNGQTVLNLSNDYIIFQDTVSGKSGVKKYNNPENIFKGNFNYITFINKDIFFAQRDDHKGRYYDADGKIIKDIDEVEYVGNLNYSMGLSNYFNYGDFIVMLKEDYDEYALLNNDLEEIVRFEAFYSYPNTFVESDYFDLNGFLSTTFKDLKTDGYIYTIGESAKDLSYTLPGLNDVGTYTYNYYDDSNNLNLEFTGYIMEDNSYYDYDTYSYVENKSISNYVTLEKISGTLPISEDIKQSKLEDIFKNEISKYLKTKGWREISSNSDEVVMESDNCTLILTRNYDSISFNIRQIMDYGD